MFLPFAELKQLAGPSLTSQELTRLYVAAQFELGQNKLAESHVLTRANPQLARVAKLNIRQSLMLSDFQKLFEQRDSSFVSAGSVASMFSPAAYLVELYREALNLHPVDSQYHLDLRRPDLSTLLLSSENLDTQVSVLDLSNELLLDIIIRESGKDYDGVMEMLSCHHSGSAAFHQPFQAVRQAILLRNRDLRPFDDVIFSPDDNAVKLNEIANDISPSIFRILDEAITAENASDLVKKTFGDVHLATIMNIDFLANHFDVARGELSPLIAVLSERIPAWKRLKLGQMLLTTDQLADDMRCYKQNQLVFLQEADVSRNGVLIERKPGKNYDDLGPIELLPLSGKHYRLRITRNDRIAAEDTRIDVGTKGEGSDDLIKDWKVPAGSGEVSFDIELDVVPDGVSIEISVYSATRSDLRIRANVGFRETSYPLDASLLKLNKLVWLYKIAGIPFDDVQSIIDSCNDNFDIDRVVLNRLLQVKFYMRHYGIDAPAAAALSGSRISEQPYGKSRSAFGQLFNFPLLDNREFVADGTIVRLGSDEDGDRFRMSVMKRAFGVNDAELRTLCVLATGRVDTPGIHCTMDEISLLYRLRLLAAVHKLGVDELATLISISPYGSSAIATINGPRWIGLVGYVDDYSRWLKDLNWAVRDLYSISNRKYPSTLTPEVEALAKSLKSALAHLNVSSAGTAGISIVAPYVAAATQLDSTELAEAILLWIDHLKPEGFGVNDLLEMGSSENETPAQASRFTTFCYVLEQLVLFVKMSGLSAQVLSWVATHPSVLADDLVGLAPIPAVFRSLIELENFFKRCGKYGPQILTSLTGDGSSEKGNLAVGTLADALGLNPKELMQALTKTSSQPYFYNWTYLQKTLRWLDAAHALGVGPNDVDGLKKLRHDSSYSDWIGVSQSLQSGLDAVQTGKLQTILAEKLSAASSAFVIRNHSPLWVTNRAELYNWLLIDNQVSGDVKTTRIAEAIASLQTYINRALADLEPGVVDSAKTGRFFGKAWDTYNKRYSTWSAAAQLAYYPENYIDPTLRKGQTGMMDELQVALSQSELTTDTVESAFNTYMTRFEEIANLEIVSGYHDHVSDAKGITYLVGRSTVDYYWRQADIEQFTDGKLPASAWTEWKKVTIAVRPINNLVRPIIFRSRLYLVWAERREAAREANGKTEKHTECVLKLAHVKHDGTWSVPQSVGTDNDSILSLLDNSPENEIGMYCACEASSDSMYVFFYKKQANYSTFPPILAGLIYSSDGEVEYFQTEKAAREVGHIFLQLDTTGVTRLNTRFTRMTNTVHVSDPVRQESSWGDGLYTVVDGCEMSNIVASVEDAGVRVQFNATLRLQFAGAPGSADRQQAVELMKKAGTIGDSFSVPAAWTQGGGRSADYNVSCIINKTKETFNFLPSGSFLSGGWGVRYVIASPGPATWSEEAVLGSNAIWSRQDNRAGAVTIKTNIIACRTSTFSPRDKYVTFGSFKSLDTSLSEENARITTSIGTGSSFTADKCSIHSFDGSLFEFSGKSFIVPLSEFRDNSAHVDIEFAVNARSGDLLFLGKERMGITLTMTEVNSLPVISLNRTPSNAQYLQYGIHRVRVNTLFAKQLVARANTGLDTVLSLETQYLQEPKLGPGSYVDVVIPAYDSGQHGSSRRVRLLLANRKTEGDQKYTFWSGLLIDSEQTIRIYIGTQQSKQGKNFPYDRYDGLTLFLSCEKGTFIQGFFENIADDLSLTQYTPAQPKVVGRDVSASIASALSEPMDFGGANALYFWEMFYYVPMMVFKRLLSEGKFDEAGRWIKYIWSPEGYHDNGQRRRHQWNVRPLEENSGWNARLVDSADPDAVAQADPVHYRIATFMGYLDLLIARGDAAYRQQNRDALNEARIWYLQAQNLLGEEPFHTSDPRWDPPSLAEAASTAKQINYQSMLFCLRSEAAGGDKYATNSLSGLFLPQRNEKLDGYWQTLAQRLFNLRHNLSINGTALPTAVYAPPEEPSVLLSRASATGSGTLALPASNMPHYRFPVILESARTMVSQLNQIGNTLLGLRERQDAEALSDLLQTQGSALSAQNVDLQNKLISEIDAERSALEEARNNARARYEKYGALYAENITRAEAEATTLFQSASRVSLAANASYTAAAVLDTAPNIYGTAVGGSQYGALARATALGFEISAGSLRMEAERLSQSEAYRRRRQDWEIQRNMAEGEVKQFDAQLAALAVRREAAVLQKNILETQQKHTFAQLNFLQNKFSRAALYSWLCSKLAAIYYQYYDLTVSTCLMAEEAYRWEMNDTSASFIHAGVWQGSYGGFTASQTLMLVLAQMENRYLNKAERGKEVFRTVRLSEVYKNLSGAEAFDLAESIARLVEDGNGSAGTESNGLGIDNEELQVRLRLRDLNIVRDYPEYLGKTRRIKQISVTLPTLLGPYQDVRAVLRYVGSSKVPRGCEAIAVSHGVNDSGQFQLDFSDGRWLPFEGIPVDDTGILALSFPDASSRQKALLQNMSDIILHIRYRIAN
ncbi:hypothetical protein KXR64_20945 [Brucella intermedia]|uniref:Tc toxin subunit A-related protein n=1 Tax=Brucella TaxID=234 RepID=UPI00147F4BE7|nr:neuraminidase-like domain-containing protein [Brucella intermedia]